MSKISITLEYNLIGNSQWVSIKLRPEEYFDLEPGEEVELDCVPKFSNTVDYLDFDSTQLQGTKLTLFDQETGSSRIFTETFWNEGKNRVIERVDKGQNEEYWELILDLQLKESPPTSEILRLDKRNGVLSPNLHVFIRRNKNGSETITKRLV